MIRVHDARSVVNEMIQRAHGSKQAITPLQVMKLTYYCHGWMLGLYHTPLLRQEVEAWLYGPVIPNVYYSLRRYGGSAIRNPWLLVGVEAEAYNDRKTTLLDEVYEHYGHLSGRRLSTLTHAKGTPWDQVWRKSGKRIWRWTGRSAVIPDPMIEAYSERLAHEP